MTTPTPQPGAPAASSAVRTAWQAALAAEHRAVFGYALLGPRLAGADRDRAHADYLAHGVLRDRTAAAIAAAGLTPVAALPDYPDLYPVDGAGAARTLAVRLEDGCAAAWRLLFLRTAVVRAARGLRDTAQTELTASAVRDTRWRQRADPGRASVPFPGL